MERPDGEEDKRGSSKVSIQREDCVPAMMCRSERRSAQEAFGLISPGSGFFYDLCQTEREMYSFLNFTSHGFLGFRSVGARDQKTAVSKE